MIHYTCDRCHRIMDQQEGNRYVVQIQVQRVNDLPEQDDESIDYLSDLHHTLEAELIEDSIAVSSTDALDSLDEAILRGEAGPLLEATQHEYDLCPDCYGSFCRNPLAREHSLNLQFSNN